MLESVNLDFSRYGDTLFEVLFAGGRLAGGGNVVEEGKKLDTNVRPPQNLLLQRNMAQELGIAHGCGRRQFRSNIETMLYSWRR